MRVTIDFGGGHQSDLGVDPVGLGAFAPQIGGVGADGQIVIPDLKPGDFAGAGAGGTDKRPADDPGVHSQIDKQPGFLQKKDRI